MEKKDADAVSIRTGAERVGVTPPSIYLHFGEKTELLFAVSERQFQELDDAAQTAASKSDDLYESLKLRGKAYVRFGLEHPEHTGSLSWRNHTSRHRTTTPQPVVGAGARRHVGTWEVNEGAPR
ncbi:MAG: TetR/AcrR family transcriptional regulator [Actinomycetota bacterium]|nr:TetR/AcrR family transcriptional regulator [Actinomycetota bacterium]